MKIGLVVILALCTFVVGCDMGGSERKITKKQEEAWKNPPKTPPAEYGGPSLPTGTPPPTGK